VAVCKPAQLLVAGRFVGSRSRIAEGCSCVSRGSLVRSARVGGRVGRGR
jgi:hypothetical protein